MFASLSLFAILATSLFARANPTPSEPGPGDVFNQGSTCHIAWQGDSDPNSVWKTTNIELMTGDNFNMIHLTTVTTVDGTQSGTFDWTCPAVTPNSAIYFYQFSSPQSTNKTWTTRFAIASESGATTPPPNALQPGTNEPIPWGVGKLVDPSSATPPPAAGSNSSSAAVSTTVTASSSVTPSNSPLPSSAPAANTFSTIRTTSASSSGSSPQASTAANSPNAATGVVVLDVRVWRSAIVLGASTLVFAFIV